MIADINFTLDLHLDLKDKKKEYDTWVERIYTVSSTLSIPYNIVWEMTEPEFILLENIAKQMIAEREKKAEALKNGDR